MVNRFIKLASVVGLLLLVGCTSTITEVVEKEVVKIVEVKVPIRVEPTKPPLRDLPTLPIHSISDSTNSIDVSEKYISTVKLLMNEVIWYRKVLY